jgi:hypothetical protein
MITKIKHTLSSVIDILYETDGSSDVPVILSKLCKDKILELQDETTGIEHNPIGNIEITYDDQFYIIDVKTQDMSKVYSVPNLISIKKAKDILTNHDNHIIYVFIEYEIEPILKKTKIVNIRVQPIETLDWSYLAIQNLGKGQLQIKNTATGLTFNNEVTRTQWLGELKDKAIEYYNNLILKVTEYKSDWEDE